MNTQSQNPSSHDETKTAVRRATRQPFLHQLHWSLPLGLVVVLALMAIIGFLVADKLTALHVDAQKYQVVYLTNGQTYFGKLQNTSGDYLYMTSPYTTQTVAPQTNGDSTNKTTENITTLLKVRDQVYGPEDTIAIRASQVAFWQNLREDSKVSQALRAKAN